MVPLWPPSEGALSGVIAGQTVLCSDMHHGRERWLCCAERQPWELLCGEHLLFPTVPESREELKSLLSGRSAEEQLLVVERIQKCNHPSLAVGNKAKLEVGWSDVL